MNKDSLNECEIVQDLLPLYYDDACSPVSRTLVEKHLKSCEKCRKMYEELKDETIDTVIKKESVGILERHAKKERNAAYKAGIIIALLLMVPIIITFLVSVSSGGGFGVLSVLTASMLLVGAVTVVPLTSSQNRLVKSILFGVVALLLILFFVDRMNGGGEFFLWSIPTIFGLSVVLFPFVIRNITLPEVLNNKKALITMSWDTLWLYLTIFVVCNASGDLEGMRAGFLVSTIMMTGVWLVFLIIRYLKVNPWIKAGITTFIVSVWMAFANDVSGFFVEHKRQLTILAVDFSNWTDTNCVNANVYVLILAIGILLSLILIAAGMRKEKAKKTK